MKKKSSFSGLQILAGLLAVSLSQADDDVRDFVTDIEVNAAKEFVDRHENAVRPSLRVKNQ